MLAALRPEIMDAHSALHQTRCECHDDAVAPSMFRTRGRLRPWEQRRVRTARIRVGNRAQAEGQRDKRPTRPWLCSATTHVGCQGRRLEFVPETKGHGFTASLDPDSSGTRLRGAETGHDD